MIKNKIIEQIFGYGIQEGCRMLCAVSGGVDSIVMLHILNEMGYDCIVAHCNFSLRGEESDGDETFVRETCLKLGVKCYVNTFDTHKYAEEMGISTQMAARKLRYDWFSQLSEELNCKYIAVAHNSDDQVETAILNFVRGTGIRGMSGMKVIYGNLFRPLLNVSRKEILQISEEGNIHFHNDSTNATTKYSRNKVRHLIVPLFEEINSAAKENILKSITYFSDTEKIMNEYISMIKQNSMQKDLNILKINVMNILKTPAPETVLFEILVSENIPKSLASDALNLLTSQSGKSCSYFEYEAFRDRSEIIVTKDREADKFNIEESFIINEIDDFADLGFKFTLCEKAEDFEIEKDPCFAYLDFDKLTFPITLRHWKQGDKFKPLGMNGFRKLSDFFKDEKIPDFEKNKIWIFESDGNIVWVAGLRIDDRYKLTGNTKKIAIIV